MSAAVASSSSSAAVGPQGSMNRSGIPAAPFIVYHPPFSVVGDRATDFRQQGDVADMINEKETVDTLLKKLDDTLGYFSLFLTTKIVC